MKVSLRGLTANGPRLKHAAGRGQHVKKFATCVEAGLRGAAVVNISCFSRCPACTLRPLRRGRSIRAGALADSGSRFEPGEYATYQLRMKSATWWCWRWVIGEVAVSFSLTLRSTATYQPWSREVFSSHGAAP